jgi:hypothetical protein
MVLRFTLYIITTLFLGCAHEVKEETTEKERSVDESVGANATSTITFPAKQAIQPTIATHLPDERKSEMKDFAKTIPDTLPQEEARISSVVPVDPKKAEPTDDVEADDEPAPISVQNKLVQDQDPPTSSPISVQQPISTVVGSQPPNPPRKASTSPSRLHRGMPVLNLWYSRKD